MVEAEFGKPADLEVLDHDVRDRRQPADESLPPIVGDIDGDGLLAAVGAQKIGRDARPAVLGLDGKRRTPAARVIALAGPLDLDHLGAHVGQELGRPGTS